MMPGGHSNLLFHIALPFGGQRSKVAVIKLISVQLHEHDAKDKEDKDPHDQHMKKSGKGFPDSQEKDVRGRREKPECVDQKYTAERVKYASLIHQLMLLHAKNTVNTRYAITQNVASVHYQSDQRHYQDENIDSHALNLPEAFRFPAGSETHQ